MFKFLRRDPKLVRAEDHLTPLEIEAALAARPGLRSAFVIGRHLEHDRAKGFIRQPLSEGAALYSAGLGAQRLLVCFTGRAHRMMVPVSVLLQFIDDRKNDLLLLTDPEKRHFEAGVPGFGTSLAELVGRIGGLARERGYASLMTAGTSMGGLPALRAGRLLGAKRAVSIGGRFSWDIERLRGGIKVRGFDPLCACVRSSASCVALHSRGVADDARSDALLGRILPSSIRIAAPFGHHNLVDGFFRAGCLARFYEILFDEDREPDQNSIDRLPHHPLA